MLTSDLLLINFLRWVLDLNSHFSQQSVLKLSAIIVVTDASMNMKSSLGKYLRQIGTEFLYSWSTTTDEEKI
uniref:Uncharacterized protein n=1 Tax=Wuchereria bancrofti TaxID=6293 RepID=A0AAF5PKX4_WUCBA